MATNTFTSTPIAMANVQRVRYERLWWVGLLAIVLAVIANLTVRAVALQFVTVSPEFMPLSEPGATFIFTAVGVLAATVVFAIVGRLTRQPARVYTIVATIALLLSLIPNVSMIINPAAAPFPGGNLGSNLVLILEHIVAAVVSVWVLTTQAIEVRPAGN